MKYFSLKELTRTSTGISNTPGAIEVENLQLLAKKVLDPARELLHAPIVVKSGYRRKEVNEIVGGVANSQHLKGQAADLVCHDNAKLFHLINENFDFDQLIWEKGSDRQPAWVHVSYSSENNRHEILYT